MLTTTFLLITIALTPAESFNQGNQCYSRNDYPAAIAAYALAVKDAPNPSAHYNLGNAYFKNGQAGRAVIEFQRARFLAPRDNDFQTNLRFVRSYRVDKNLAMASPFTELIDGALHWPSLREAALLAAIGFGLGALLFSLFIVFRRTLFLIAGIVALIPFLYGAVTAAVWQTYRSSRPAVVVVSEANARSGPGEDYKDIVLIHDGTEIVIKEIRGDWLLAQLPGGAGGWVKREAVEQIFP
jgi:tetratricopeptide (TPR) repeat protein